MWNKCFRHFDVTESAKLVSVELVVTDCEEGEEGQTTPR